MASLADELLQDFDDSGSEGENNVVVDEGNDAFPEGNGAPKDEFAMELDGDEEAPDDDEDMGGVEVKPTDDTEAAKARIEKMQLSGVHDVRSVAGLMKTLTPVLEVSDALFPRRLLSMNAPGSNVSFTSQSSEYSPDAFHAIMQKIAHYKTQDSQANNFGNIEDNPEYHLLTESNSLSTQIDSEIMLVHKYIRDHYSVRFEELERLVEHPLDYAKAVAILGNGPFDSESIKSIQNSTDNPLGVNLRSVLDGPSLMIVTVEATTSRGRDMTPEQLVQIVSACKMVVDLYNAKDIITEYVQSRMNIFAPNLTALVGSLTAAQLLNAAGGLTGLAKTPASNIAAWGSKKKSNVGLATNVGIRQQGFLYNSPVVKGAPMDLKKNAMRIVSAKTVLAARIDRVHQSPEGGKGQEFKAQCLERLEKLSEPAPNARTRALPMPDDKPSRKRGGRRARKAKEAVAMTDLRKAQNRMVFGKEEKEVGYGTGDSTAGMGMIGMENDGRIRAVQVDQRTRAKLSKNNKGWGAIGGTASSLGGSGPGDMDLRGKGLRTSGVGTHLGGGGTATGTASSLAFNPGQGLQLVVPKSELAKKRKAEEDRFFNSGTFTQVGQPPAKKVKMGPPAPK
ncbi:hypothetical protein MKZ38_006347 [Zalerion maritima]|uniref:Nop domain-containing protein n=1 Tax=Zalerion maritima TaxID=339359 RepID=A0AAD5WUI5_9PEZI|nr:hypothetical protein MKZ38_006347 [Zalerion maritima]